MNLADMVFFVTERYICSSILDIVFYIKLEFDKDVLEKEVDILFGASEDLLIQYKTLNLL